MYSDEAILGLIDSVYAAAADPAMWTDLLERLTEALHGHIGTLHHQNLASTESSFAADWNMDPDAVAQYTAHFAPLNVWFKTRQALLTEGQVFTNAMLCPDDLLIRTEFYNDWLKPHNMGQAIGAMVFRSGPAASSLSVFRPINQPAFEEDDLRLMRALMPHFQRAFQLHNRIQGLEQKADAATVALEHLSAALVLVGTGGRVLQVNKAAAAILAGERGMRATSRGLLAEIPSENQRLQRLIREAINTGSGKGFEAGGAMMVARQGSKRSLQVLVVPLRTRTVQIDKDVPTAAVFISDPDREPISEAQVFAELFSLTPAESRLAQVLATGNSLKEASEQLGVAESTIKSHLKSIFAKTDTKRQSELVRLLLMAPTHPVPMQKVSSDVLR